MVSKASDDLPEPLSPVITVRRVAGNLDVDILQVVLARAMHGDPVQHSDVSGKGDLLLSRGCAGSANCVITRREMRSARNAAASCRRVHRTFFERFSYMAIYECQRVQERGVCAAPLSATTSARTAAARMRHVPRHAAQAARQDRPHARRLAELAGAHVAAGRLYHCRFCRIQFYDRRTAPRRPRRPPEQPRTAAVPSRRTERPPDPRLTRVRFTAEPAGRRQAAGPVVARTAAAISAARAFSSGSSAGACA